MSICSELFKRRLSKYMVLRKVYGSKPQMEEGIGSNQTRHARSYACKSSCMWGKRRKVSAPSAEPAICNYPGSRTAWTSTFMLKRPRSQVLYDQPRSAEIWNVGAARLATQPDLAAYSYKHNIACECEPCLLRPGTWTP